MENRLGTIVALDTNLLVTSFFTSTRTRTKQPQPHRTVGFGALWQPKPTDELDCARFRTDEKTRVAQTISSRNKTAAIQARTVSLDESNPPPPQTFSFFPLLLPRPQTIHIFQPSPSTKSVGIRRCVLRPGQPLLVASKDAVHAYGYIIALPCTGLPLVAHTVVLILCTHALSFLSRRGSKY